MKLLAALMVGLIACGCGAPQGPDASPSVPVKDDERAMLITKTCQDGSRWVGTGYEVDDETIVTAAHVVNCGPPGTAEKPSELTLEFLSGRVVDVTDSPVELLLEFDVAAVMFHSDAPTLEVVESKPNDVVCFYPAAPERGQKCGTVLAVEEGADGMMMLIDVVPGNSGSAIINDGKFTGVVTSKDYIFGYGTPVVLE